jgi:GT2 family glycosyltransferase
MYVSDSVSPATLIAYAGTQLQFDSAFSLIDRACRQANECYAPVLALRGRVHHHRGDLAAASEDFLKALILEPRQFDYLKNLAVLASVPEAQKRLRVALGLHFRLWPESAADDVILPLLKASGLHALGAVWSNEEGLLNGWAVGGDGEPLTIEVDLHRYEVRCDLPTPFLQQHGIGDGYNGFCIRLPDNWGVCRLGIGRLSLWGSPILSSRRDLESDNRRWGGPHALNNTTFVPRPVDVLVPVYAGLKDTLACLNALREASYASSIRVIVINDASPDPALGRALRERAAIGEFELIERPFNAGFLGAINTGLLFSENDVVLLNADTIVANDWLDRLQRTAYSSHDIGTATPLTNHGELVSYPHPMKANLAPNALATQALDKLFAAEEPSRAIEIPTGVGFCLYIRRAVLDQIGGLDERSAYRGYGEETDFCLRARQKGWRHVCATDVFVTHQGSISFGSEKSALALHNTSQIQVRYPEHGERYQKFLDTNPLKLLHQKVQRKWLALLKPGIGKNCSFRDPESLAQHSTALSPEEVSFQLTFQGKGESALICLMISGVPGLGKIEYAPGDLEALVEDLQAAGITKLDIGSVALWPRAVIETLTERFSFDIRIEDYSAWCPRRYLLQNQASICEDPMDPTLCERCLSHSAPLIPNFPGLEAWKSYQESLFTKAGTIKVPCHEMAQRYQRRYPGLKLTLIPAPRLPALVRKNIRCVAVPALRHPHQGFNAFQKVAREARDTRFVVFGEVFEPRQLSYLPNVHLLGSVEPEKWIEALKDHRCEAISDFSPWPSNPWAWADLARAARLPLLPLSFWC